MPVPRQQLLPAEPQERPVEIDQLLRPDYQDRREVANPNNVRYLLHHRCLRNQLPRKTKR